MKKFLAIIVVVFSPFLVAAQNSNPNFNKALADSLGADQYGMKMYVMVILKSGTANITDKASLDSIFRGHMNNIGRMAKLGKLVIAGPFQKNDRNYRGIYIFNASLDETKQLVQSDPAVKEKLLEPEIYEWYGSAALPVYLPYHEKVWVKKP